MRTSLMVAGAAIAVGVFLSVNLSVPASRERGNPGASTSSTSPLQEEDEPPRLRLRLPSAGCSDPRDLPLLEGPDRAIWQRPDQVMDLLRIAEGSKVADIGAGAGWFTIRLARRVGENGRVYAQDLQREMVIAIARRVEREQLQNVTVIQGLEDSPNLPHGVLDAVLVVDVYPEVKEGVMFLRSLAASLKAKGRIGIVNYKPGTGGPGPEPDQRVAGAIVERDAKTAQLRVVSRTDLKYQYLIVLERENRT